MVVLEIETFEIERPLRLRDGKVVNIPVKTIGRGVVARRRVPAVQVH